MAVAEAAGADWSERTVLITGAGGLLANWLSRALLDAGATIVGLDNDWDGPRQLLPAPGVERIDGDIRNAALVREILGDRKVDTVFHLAAQTLVGPALDDPVDTFSNNIEGTWVVLEACRAAGAAGAAGSAVGAAGGVRRIVVASSDKAYGDHGGRPYTEQMALRAHHPYDASKAITDVLAQTYAHTYGLPLGITRCGNLYGGGDLNWSRIVPGTIRSVLAGEAPVIRSDGTFVRDYLYVRDAAAGVLSLADVLGRRPELAGTAVNFAAGNRHSVLDVVRRILALMGSELEPAVLGLPLKEIPEQRVSAGLARKLLGWKAATSMDDGLRETIDWYRRYLASPQAPAPADRSAAADRSPSTPAR